MKIIWSLFPKFYRHLSPEQLAELVGQVGLDTTTVVIREGYWVTYDRLATELPAFCKAIRKAGLEVHWATTGLMPELLLRDDTALRILADNGLREFRMGQWHYERGPDVRDKLAAARAEMEQLAGLCGRHGLRCVHQLHHNTLVAAPSGIYELVRGLPSESVGVAIDPGNQAYDGMENWHRSAHLLGEYLCGMGVKDTAVVRDAARADEPDKGWRREWATLHEGVTNWHEAIAALDEIGFDGTFVFMPFYNPDDPEETTRKLRREVEYLRGVVASVTDS